MLLTYDQDIEGAIEQFQQVIALGGADDAAVLQVARLKERSGDEAGATATYRDYLERRAFDPDASIALASLEERQGRPELARERLFDALAHHDSAPRLQGALAVLLIRQGQFQEARAAVAGLDESESLEEKDLALQVAEGIARSRGQITEALALRERRIELTATGTLALARLSLTQDYAEDLEGGALSTDHDALLEAAFPGQDEVASLLREMSRLQFALRIGGVADLERGRAALERMISRFGRRDLGFLVTLVDARIAQLQDAHAQALESFAEAHAGFLRDDGRTTLSEAVILRLWLESATAAADAEAGETPARLLARLLPNHPRALLVRARFLHATGDASAALAVAEQALAACSHCDDDYAPKGEIHRLLDELPQPSAR
jgi:tetratricopeptide (TPR) repeat protein